MPGQSSNPSNKLNKLATLATLEEFELQLQRSSLTNVCDPFLRQHKTELWIKRDDLLHPIVSGNKWRKLKYVLHHALLNNNDSIVSMGGQYSNHLHALAYIGKVLNVTTTAFVRGEKPKHLNPTLKDCHEWGMQLKFISRSSYRELRDVCKIPMQQPNEYWLPEGGAVKYALQGIAKIIEEINIPFDVLCVPCGTATTLAGLIDTVQKRKIVIGFAALKGRSFLEQNVQKLLKRHIMTDNSWLINHDYHFGGFANTQPELINFIHYFQKQTGIELELVYTGKMLYGIYDLIEQGFFRAGQRIIAIHTGGLQGNRGFVSG